MSNAVFPSLPGETWSVFKTPIWSTGIQKKASGRELRAAFFSYPLWQFKLSFDVLRANSLAEFQTLAGFFNARQGSFDSFLYSDPTDNAVTAERFGTGDGVTTAFQLLRALGGYAEPVVAVQATPQIYKTGVLQSSGVSVDTSTGLVTFSVAPAAGVVLTWTGNFYYRCRFLHDSTDFENFAKNFWKAQKVEFITEKL